MNLVSVAIMYLMQYALQAILYNIAVTTGKNIPVQHKKRT